MIIDSANAAEEFAQSWIREASPSAARRAIQRAMNDRRRMLATAKAGGRYVEALTDVRILRVFCSHLRRLPEC